MVRQMQVSDTGCMGTQRSWRDDIAVMLLATVAASVAAFLARLLLASFLSSGLAWPLTAGVFYAVLVGVLANELPARSRLWPRIIGISLTILAAMAAAVTIFFHLTGLI